MNVWQKINMDAVSTLQNIGWPNKGVATLIFYNLLVIYFVVFFFVIIIVVVVLYKKKSRCFTRLMPCVCASALGKTRGARNYAQREGIPLCVMVVLIAWECIRPRVGVMWGVAFSEIDIPSFSDVSPCIVTRPSANLYPTVAALRVHRLVFDVPQIIRRRCGNSHKSCATMSSDFLLLLHTSADRTQNWSNPAPSSSAALLSTSRCGDREFAAFM